MKTTKEIAEILFEEIDRVAKGEIRKDVIVALSQCTDSLVKLARLEMDYAVQNWADNKPTIPWLNGCKEAKHIALPPEPQSTSVKGQQIEKQLFDAREQLKTAKGTMQSILTDKIKHLEVSLVRVEQQASAEESD